MQGLAGELIDSVLELPGAFGAVAANDPVGAVLLAVGLALVGFASAVMGYLTLGAAVELVTPT